jgi:MoxR-like ATPase
MWGEPGTGKTTAVRALAREWAPWCKTSYVLDPEALFGSSEYFHEVTLAEAGHHFSSIEDLLDEAEFDEDESITELVQRTTTPEWRLLVVEDADELISADAKVRAGQALSRLLNLTDGIVGQGMRTIVLITTNEPLSKLHPALSRPGRCLAQVEVGTFTRVEAHEWLSVRGRTDIARALTKSEFTLAELYEVLGDSQKLSQAPQVVSQVGYL